MIDANGGKIAEAVYSRAMTAERANPAAIRPELARACAARLASLRLSLAGSKLDGLLVSGEHDILYLTGFVGHDSLLLVTPADAVIICDPRYDEFLDPWRHCSFATVVMGTRHRLEVALAERCRQLRVRRLGIQAEQVVVARHARLRASLAEVELMETIGLVSTLRMRKDAMEVAAIERALHVQQQSLRAALRQLTAGMTEQQFCAVLEFEMKSRGSMRSGFDPIIAAGPNSSVPHHATGSTRIDESVLLVDWGAVSDGYCGDLTRTFVLGTVPPKIREIYPIVLEAQLAAIDAIAPGKVCAEIDEVARRVIRDAGYGEQFAHGLGHGLGIDVHEEPYFNNLATETVLVPGMVMTVEPGIYIPGVGGVRIEDDIVVTDRGCRVLSDFPKDLDSAVIEPAGAHAASGAVR
jgi:Xaa-Pro aminopeptidase